MPVTSTLIQNGVVQGACLSCKPDNLSKGAKEAIMDGRAVAAHRSKPVGDEHLLLVLSQDCDINNTQDHYIEVLAIKKLPQKKLAHQQQENRNYRKLQLPIGEAFWSLEADLISIIPKSALEDCNLDIHCNLDERAFDILIDWRVSRYNRIPFPDQFNQDFLINYIKSPEYTLGSFLEEYNGTILDLYIYVDPQDEEHAEEYTVSIIALVREDCSGEEEQIIRDELTKHCKTLHDLQNTLKMCQVDPSYEPDNYEISQEIVMKPSDFTLLDAIYFRRITLDYLCYS